MSHSQGPGHITTYHGEMAPASHSRKKSEMVSALAELDTNEEFWPSIVLRISDGEFLSTLAEELKVNHSILRNWIRGNKAREQAYQQAERDGKSHRINLVLKNTYSMATKEIADPPTRMEQLRAAEILLKQDSGEAKPPTHVANIAITFVSANNGKPEERVIDPVP